MDNRQIATLISERIGPRPVPFEAVRTLALEIYNELGGEETQFDSVYSILLETLTLVKGVVEYITYDELKTKRDNSELAPGKQYRITDYVTTTVQANTQSAGHQFDIIVVADSEDKLNEDARAIQHIGDTYFAKSNLESWELKYCLDNDTNRFSWADTTNGKGVIYHMKDEWNNECPYDFKNIQFKRWEVTYYVDVPALVVNDRGNYYGYYYGAIYLDGEGQILSEATYGPNSGWFYTFALNDVASGKWYDYTVVNALGLKNNENNEVLCYGNKINELKEEYYSGKGEMPIILNNIVIFNCYGDLSNTSYTDTYSYCNSNTFGNNCDSNTFGNNCRYNTFGNGCYSNTFGNDCYSNAFGNDCYSNTFGNSGGFNTFGNGCSYNVFGNYCYNNMFGNVCGFNIFGNDGGFNTFGTSCSYNTFGNNFKYNTFGKMCISSDFTRNYDTSLEPLQYINVLSGFSVSGAVPSGIVLGATYEQIVGLNSQKQFTVKKSLG